MGIDRRLTPEGRLERMEAKLNWVLEVLLALLEETDNESCIRVA